MMRLLNRLVKLAVVVAVAVVAGQNIAQADPVSVSGWGSITIPFIDEASDVPGGKNTTEGKTTVRGEVDFQKTIDDTTFRLDLDFPTSLNEPGAGPDEIEQAKFVHKLSQEMGLTLTGGVFNAPIGFEAQDAPDLLQVTKGQLFNLLPKNLAGFMVGGSAGPLKLDVYYANEWRSNADKEESIGGRLTLAPTDKASLAVGYITADEPTSPADDLLDVVVQTTAIPNVLLAAEYLDDDAQTGWAAVANFMHGPHGLTLRYDSVDPNTAGAPEPTSFTVAALCKMKKGLSTILEWKTTDLDTVAGNEDLLALRFVATL